MSRKIIIGLIGFAMILVVGGGVWYVLGHKPRAANKQITVTSMQWHVPTFSSSPDDTDYVNHTTISAVADALADKWTLRIYDAKNNLIKEISTGKNNMVDIKWDGSDASGHPVDSGVYSYKIEAKLGKYTSYGEGTIIIDKTRPKFVDTPFISTSIIKSSTDVIAIKFSADEELDGLAIKVYDSANNYIWTISSLPSLDKGEPFECAWKSANDLPNGTYKIKIYIVDKYGNRNEEIKSIIVDIPSNTAPPLNIEERQL